MKPPPGGANLETAQSSATERKIQIAFAVALASLLLVGTMSYIGTVRLKESARWVEHTHAVLDRLSRLMAGMADAETAERGYVIAQDPDYLATFKRSVAGASAIRGELAELTRDNPLQQQRLAALSERVSERLRQFDLVLSLRDAQGFAAAQQEILKGLGKRNREQTTAIIASMSETEQTLLAERDRQAQRSASFAQATAWAGGLLAFVFLGFAAFAILRDFAGRARAERALRAARDELEVRVRERTAQLQAANDTLAASERKFRAFVSATTDVVYRMSPDWTEMYHLEGQEFIPDTFAANRDWIDLYIDQQDQSLVREAIARAIAAKSTFELEHRVRRTDGTLGWTFSRAIPLLAADGRILEWFGAASDVTPRKEAETKLRAQLARLALLSQITRAIGERQDIKSIFQVTIRTLEENLPADFCAVCLYESGSDELTVISVGVHSGPIAVELAMTEQARVPIDANGLSRCVQGRLVYEPELEQLSFPFPQRLVRGGLKALVAAPLLVESQVFGVLLAARREPRSFSSGECEFLKQVSEHVALASHQAQLYSALQRAYEDLRQTQQAVMQQERLLALGKMASGIAHDINNAISPVGLYTESLLEREPDLSPRTRQYLETIQRAIEDVAHTVSRMREFYRQRDSETEAHRVDLNPLIQQVLDLTQARWSDMAQRRGIVIQVHVELEKDLPPVMGVEAELRDALTNLIFNAVDAMPQGGQLSLRTREIVNYDSRTLVQLEVADTGVGMDEATRGRCLEPFFTTKGDRGTGLGLAMVYGTVQRHNAEIAIDSTLGQGTTFRLSFAAATAAEAIIRMPAQQAAKALRILVVDDDPVVLNSMRDILGIDGHTVLAVDGGQAGIDAFHESVARGQPYDVVITDLGMPHVDGRRVSAAVKRAAASTFVIMLTGWGQRLMASGDVPEDVDQVLSKPPKLRELRQALTLAVHPR